MCIKNRIQQTLAEIAEKQERLATLEKLESATAPIKNSLIELLADYSDEAPEELPEFWQEILAIGQKFNLSAQPLAADELKAWEATNAENESLRIALQEAQTELLEYRPNIDREISEEAKLMARGLRSFGTQIQSAQPLTFLAKLRSQRPTPTIRAEYKLVTGNDASELSEAQCQQQLEVSSRDAIVPEYEPDEAYNTVESIFQSHGFSQHDADMPPDWDASELRENYRGWDIFCSIPNGGIVAIGLNNSKINQFWDASTEYIQEIEGNGFPESLGDYDAIVAWTRTLIDQVENLQAPSQLALEFPDPESETVLTDAEYDAAVEEELALDDGVDLIELFSISNLPLPHREMRARVEPTVNEGEFAGATFWFYDYKGNELFNSLETVEQTARGEHNPSLIATALCEHWVKREGAQWWEQTAKTKIASKPIAQEGEPNTEPAKPETDTEFEAMGFQVQVYPQPPMGVTFRFLNVDGTVAFSNSLTTPEVGDRTWKVCAWDLIQNYRDKETARLEKLANPYATEEDKFVELVKVSNDVGYLKEKATGKILEGYVTFSNKKNDGTKTQTQAKTRAQKWTDYLRGTYQLECDAPRSAKRMVSDNTLQPFAYKVKILKPSIGQLTKLAEEDLSLLPLEQEDKQNRAELRSLKLKNDSGSDEIKATEKVTEPEPLTDNEIKIVELIRAALSKFNAEAVQEINSAEVPELVRNKVWESLSAEEQKTYELLLKLEFTEAPDFSVKTPEFTTSVDGKQGKSVFLSLRVIDGETRKVWRYQGQNGDSGYSCKEAAAVAVWLQ